MVWPVEWTPKWMYALTKYCIVQTLKYNQCQVGSSTGLL